VRAHRTPIGYLPFEDDLEVGGSNISLTDLAGLLDVDPAVWLEETRRSDAFFATFGDRLPLALRAQQRDLVQRLEAAASR